MMGYEKSVVHNILKLLDFETTASTICLSSLLIRNVGCSHLEFLSKYGVLMVVGLEPLTCGARDKGLGMGSVHQYLLSAHLLDCMCFGCSNK